MSHQHLNFGELLRAKGYRLTRQRQLILDAVCETGGHASPDAICARVRKRAPAINRTTVYRALEFLCEMGLITSTLARNGHLTYEIAGEEHHHHLVCNTCGREKTIPDEFVAPMLAAIGQAYNFHIVELTHLSLFGVCAKCRSAH
jgi:Fur family ferric uptake transcriptional regulator